MNFLITGATGYIGRHLVERLTKEGHHCRCLVRKSSTTDLLANYSNTECFFGDIAQKPTLSGACKEIEIVINCAGRLGKWNSSIDELGPVNADGISNLCDEILGNDVKYVIHLSAGGVTGPVTGYPADETYVCEPRTPYEKTKWEGEKNALRLYEQHNLPIVVVRPTFTYGPQDPHKLPLFRAVKKGSFVFVGSGESVNHPVYIDDLISGITLILRKQPIGETFILGGPRPVTKNELISVIAKTVGSRKTFLHIPRWLASCGAVGMLFLAKILNFEPILTPSRVSMMADNWGYSIKKANEKLGYVPNVDLETGIGITARSYVDLGWL